MGKKTGARSLGDVSANVFAASCKHSLTIAGHPTSIRIESLFWDALIRESERLSLPVNALVAEIDVARLMVDPAPNLASAIRLWLFANGQPASGADPAS